MHHTCFRGCLFDAFSPVTSGLPCPFFFPRCTERRALNSSTSSLAPPNSDSGIQACAQATRNSSAPLTFLMPVILWISHLAGCCRIVSRLQNSTHKAVEIPNRSHSSIGKIGYCSFITLHSFQLWNIDRCPIDLLPNDNFQSAKIFVQLCPEDCLALFKLSGADLSPRIQAYLNSSI